MRRRRPVDVLYLTVEEIRRLGQRPTRSEYDRLHDIFYAGGRLKKSDIRGTWDGDSEWLFADGSALTWLDEGGDHFMAHLSATGGI